MPAAHRSPPGLLSALAMGGLLALSTLAGCRTTPPAGTPDELLRRTASRAGEPIAPGDAKVTFDAVWLAVNEPIVAPFRARLDWEAVGREFREQLPAVTTVGELRSLLQAMLDRLGSSHFAIVPSELTAGLEVAPPDELGMPSSVLTRLVSEAEWHAAGGAAPLPSIGVIVLPAWLPEQADEIDRAFESLSGCAALIVDLRGNSGGVGALAMGVGGHVLATPTSLGKLVQGELTFDYMVNPRRVTADGRSVEPFAGPLVLLVDRRTASTSEIFAAGLQAAGRALVVGERTAGTALSSVFRTLPNRDLLQVAVADFVTAAGNRIEGHGVEPDVPVVEAERERADRDDRTLAAALAALRLPQE